MDDPLMPLLEERIADPTVAACLLVVADELRAELSMAPDQPKSTFRAVPLTTYGALPDEIRSSWVFALRGGTFYPPERHPNSIQRMFAVGTTGWFDTWSETGSEGGWITHELTPGGAGLSIPVNAWHRLTEQPDDWAVVSFHTAAETELIEIVGDPETGEIRSTGTYVPGEAA